MIKSMTGYGKSRSISKTGTFTVEIRSLNHKYFDMACRLPNNLSIFEDKVRDHVKKRVKRGRVNLFASWESKKKADTHFSLNIAMAKKYHHEMLRLKKNLGLKDDIGITEIIAMPEVIVYEQVKDEAPYLWPYLKKALDHALGKLERMREAEGRRLQKDLMKRVTIIRVYLGKIEGQLPKVIDKYRDNLFKKVKTFSGVDSPDHERIAEEVALFVRNSDVSEELTRIKSHLKGFKSTLRTHKETGKEADFIAQEMFREANTIGAKASSFRISRWVIKIKSQIEKMREQIQNVE
ncbi:MAG: YicC family protein [Candidatus Omnitrophica bacterium]|nr:YicC family protein [Candidatus Omnitrophota bacterium]